MSIAIISDTDTSLPQHILDQYNIRQASITIHFGEEILKACSEITDEQLVERVNRDGIVPTTAAPSPGDFAETFQEAFDKGYSQVLWLDAIHKKHVEEVGAMNIFLVSDDILYTAPLDSGTILHGVTRESVIHMAKNLGYTVKEEALSIDTVI